MHCKYNVTKIRTTPGITLCSYVITLINLTVWQQTLLGKNEAHYLLSLFRDAQFD